MLLVNSKIIILSIIFTVIYFSFNFINAQEEDEFENLFIRLQFAPPVIESGTATYPIGYVGLVDSEGSPVLAPEDLIIELTSSNPSIVSIPTKVTIPVNSGYVNFDVKVTESEGVSQITAIFQGQELTKPFRVGGISVDVPINVELQISLPSETMHVDTEMPISVFLENEGTILQAPKDINIKFEYEKSIFTMNNDNAVIKKGDYFTTSILKTLQKTGNGFIKATSVEPSLDTFRSITVSSSLPTKLQVNVFPDILIHKVDRELDIFVTLVDEDGNPVVATRDVEFELFSDYVDIDDKLDDDFEIRKPKIRKGDWGFYHRQGNFFLNAIDPKNILGAISKDYGLAEHEFKVVTVLKESDVRAENKTLKIYTLPKMPPDSTSVVAYQVSAIKGNDDDEDAINALVAAGTTGPHEFDDEDFYDEGDTYPIEIDFDDFDSQDLKGKVASSKPDVIQILDPGKVSPERSYGTAIIKSGKKAGTAEISAALKRVATGVQEIEVYSPLNPSQTALFSPAGKRIIFNNEGIAELYAVFLDTKGRPAKTDELSFVVFPINELVEVTPKNTFSKIPLKSSLFAKQLEAGIANVTWTPIGTDINTDLHVTKLFPIAPSSSTAKIFLPFTSIVSEDNAHRFGIVQLADFFGNPVQVTNDLKIELKTNNTKNLEIPKSVTIPSGKSFSSFLVTTFGDSGTSTISATVKGFFGSEAILQQVPFIKELIIFPVGPLEAIELGQSVEIQVFVDDENTVSVEGAELEFFPTGNSTVFPKTIKTDKTGEAVVLFTANDGPISTIEIFATKPGYLEDQTTLEIQVSGFEEDAGPETILGIDPLILYAAIGGAVAGVGGVAFRLLRKPKVVTEEELEEEEI